MTRTFDDPRHRESEELAFFAEAAFKRGDEADARAKYARAAELEEAVALDVEPLRLRSLFAVSAVACWFKAGDRTRLEQAAARLTAGSLMDEARKEIAAMLESAPRQS